MVLTAAVLDLTSFIALFAQNLQPQVWCLIAWFPSDQGQVVERVLLCKMAVRCLLGRSHTNGLIPKWMQGTIEML